MRASQMGSTSSGAGGSRPSALAATQAQRASLRAAAAAAEQERAQASMHQPDSDDEGVQTFETTTVEMEEPTFFELLTGAERAKRPKQWYIDVQQLYPPEYWDRLRNPERHDPELDDELEKMQAKYGPKAGGNATETRAEKLVSADADENRSFLTAAAKNLKNEFTTEEEVFETMVHLASSTHGCLMKERLGGTGCASLFVTPAPVLRYFDVARKKDEWVLDYYIDKEYREDLRPTVMYNVNDDRGTVMMKLIKKVWKGQHDYRHQLLIIFNEYDVDTGKPTPTSKTMKMELTCQNEKDCGVWCRVLKMFVAVAKQEHLGKVRNRAQEMIRQREANDIQSGLASAVQSQRQDAGLIQMRNPGSVTEGTAPEEGGYYDEAGNWIDTTGAAGLGYYDDEGNWVDAATGEVTKAEDLDGYWDESGNWVTNEAKK
ncbi:unnamed protein product [Amoebophrya sp. A25]|nr:unnamed protein product [Amoebophrya sp. A25]|eukprot:GSA25T00019561001.1